MLDLFKSVLPSAMPDADPVIIGAPKVMKPGEQIFLNCTSDYSLPSSDINWYIDNELQKVCKVWSNDCNSCVQFENECVYELKLVIQ